MGECSSSADAGGVVRGAGADKGADKGCCMPHVQVQLGGGALNPDMTPTADIAIEIVSLVSVVRQ